MIITILAIIQTIKHSQQPKIPIDYDDLDSLLLINSEI